MIRVDSSVWIDYFNGALTPQTEKLDQLLGREFLAIGDLILVEVLQGFSDDVDFERAHASLRIVRLGGADIAIQAASNFRKTQAPRGHGPQNHRYRNCHLVHPERL